jgi:hypothetical protein
MSRVAMRFERWAGSFDRRGLSPADDRPRRWVSGDILAPDVAFPADVQAKTNSSRWASAFCLAEQKRSWRRRPSLLITFVPHLLADGGWSTTTAFLEEISAVSHGFGGVG